ncbi:deoxynucleotidyltransferase terminal-interacting protein 2 [Betta splendens]|uniref:Deoxynucleotidyltransferase terminal-interacting protein 2 n=1 Tax=Betta splendens TaxID=158456 RepID=A0A6P7M6H1_BETSP|nr:deoxynucleotidyltransferase terminal-interacting protein 2 [Betta splendens]
MVVTRSGVHVQSPTKTESDHSSDVQATPSTGRRTRRTAAADTAAQDAPVETSSQLHESEGEPSARHPTVMIKRCAGISTTHSPQQPSTPAESTHEADVSDLESVASDIEPLATRIRSRRRQSRPLNWEEEEASEAESCSSAVSASNTGSSVRRSTRKRMLPKGSDPAPVWNEDVKVDQVLETEKDVSERVTRTQRKAACTRSSVKKAMESEASDAESCISGVSTDKASKSITRRSTRSTRQTCPIPIYLDEASESSQSPAPTGRRTRAARGKPALTVDASEPQSCDSDGFESGPVYSMSARRRGRTQSKATDSESELTDLHSPNHSPCPTQGRGTPCSSRAGSANSRQGALTSRPEAKELSMVVETDSSLNDSRLDSTLVNEDADCTVLVDEQGENVIGDSHVSDLDRGTAETTEDQRAELSTENEDRDASEMEITHPSLGERTVGEDAGGETQSRVVETMEVSAVTTDDQHMADSSEAQVESILVTSEQQHEITVVSDSENPPTDITVRKAKVVSLLDSSDEEDGGSDEEEEKDDSEDDDLESREDERGGPSKTSDSAGASVEGLFMIDTRPGEDADEHYYKDKSTEPQDEEEATRKHAEQEPQDEEFIDEEGDDEDDEDTEILYSSRNVQGKELSSRIDPGLKVKALGGLYINFHGSKSKPVSSSLLKLKEKKIQDEVMKKSVIGPDFEKKDAVPPYKESKHVLKQKHREERAKSTGEGWFNMKAPELSHELKGDLQVLKMRDSLDPKRFYKKNDRDGFPKYFQVGTVVDSPVDFYHSRVPKKQRKRTMVEELLADAEFRHKNKKKFQHILMETAAQAAGKKNKNKNKSKNKKKFKKN